MQNTDQGSTCSYISIRPQLSKQLIIFICRQHYINSLLHSWCFRETAILKRHLSTSSGYHQLIRISLEPLLMHIHTVPRDNLIYFIPVDQMTHRPYILETMYRDSRALHKLHTNSIFYYLCCACCALRESATSRNGFF